MKKFMTQVVTLTFKHFLLIVVFRKVSSSNIDTSFPVFFSPSTSSPLPLSSGPSSSPSHFGYSIASYQSDLGLR